MRNKKAKQLRKFAKRIAKVEETSYTGDVPVKYERGLIKSRGEPRVVDKQTVRGVYLQLKRNYMRQENGI